MGILRPDVDQALKQLGTLDLHHRYLTGTW